MKIAIVGAGRIGSSLARGLTRKGHEIHVGTRRADQLDDQLKDLQQAIGPAGKIESSKDATADAEVVVLALPWRSAPDVIAGLGRLDGKVIIDCMNPFRPDRSGLEVGLDRSLAEDIQQRLPHSHVVKAFNHVTFEHLQGVTPGAALPAIIYCGDDAKAKETVAGLIRDLGFEPIDAGALTMSRLLEPVGLLYSRLAREQGYGRDVAFGLLRRTFQV